MATKIPTALIQMSVAACKETNLRNARDLICKAAAKIKASALGQEKTPLIVLPECFNSPYGTQYFEEYAEEIPGKTTEMLSSVAKDEGVYLIGGSMPEKRSEKLYNTATAYNPRGEMIMKYSKIHLFDIDIPGKIRFKESEVLTAGDELGMFEMSNGVKIGMGICYDMRFPELSILLAKASCDFLVFPGAFNMTTGPLHWELLQKGRAIDNQLYVAACSPARDETATYIAWGHSSVVDPWGEVIAKAAAAEEIIYAEIDLEKKQAVRQQIPVQTQKRDDVYKVTGA
ncbi:omega-amidase NIT2-like [Watersipora subatra]|uniref:omega-amidase NIT2-like n=1 Tax=Watersipora subatra TaxID=2589382 RepID=UPI00355C69F6